MPDAEVVQVVNEIMFELPVLQAKAYFLRISHTTLLKAVLIHCGVPENVHQAVYSILGDSMVTI